jgi:UDP-glucose 4-epimerase
MYCVVTGAAGFIGSHLVDALLSMGHTVLGVDDLSTGKSKNLELAAKSENFFFLKKSVVGLCSSDISLGRVDWFFHLAGRADLVPSIMNPREYFSVNVDGTFDVLEVARALEVKRFIYTASSTCYGIPAEYPTLETSPCVVRHPYGLTKLMGEELTLHWSRVYKIPALSLRLFNVYGPRSRTTGAYGAVFGVFLKQKLAGAPFTVVGDGCQTRDFTYVSDVADAFVASAECSYSGGALNVGSGHTYSVNHLVQLLGGPVVYLPKRPGEPDCTFADIGKIRQEVGWLPKISLEEGVRRMLRVMDEWCDAPLWDPNTIAEATRDWFRYLS